MTDLEKALAAARKINEDDKWKSDDLQERAWQVNEYRKLIIKNAKLLSEQFLAIHAELTALREKTRWIPVEERLPEVDYCKVVLEVEGALEYAEWYREKFHLLTGTVVYLPHIIRYIIIPDPPESEE